MRHWIAVTAFVAVLLGCTPLARASVVSSLTTTLNMNCLMFSTVCTFDPGSRGSPEQGMADFTPVAPGWSATFYSDPAIAWGFIHRTYFAGFGGGPLHHRRTWRHAALRHAHVRRCFQVPNGVCSDSRLVSGLLEQWVVRGRIDVWGFIQRPGFVCHS